MAYRDCHPVRAAVPHYLIQRCISRRRPRLLTLTTMPPTRARTRRLGSTSTISVIAILVVTLSACGSTDGPDEGATKSSGSSTGQPSASSADPNAGWHTARDDGGQFLVPPDWEVEEIATGFALKAPQQRAGGSRVGDGIFGSSTTLDSAEAIDDAADVGVAFHKKGGYETVERLPDVTFGGVTFYHVRGQDSGTRLDDYGTVNDSQVDHRRVALQTRDGGPQAG